MPNQGVSQQRVPCCAGRVTSLVFLLIDIASDDLQLLTHLFCLKWPWIPPYTLFRKDWGCLGVANGVAPIQESGREASVQFDPS